MHVIYRYTLHGNMIFVIYLCFQFEQSGPFDHVIVPRPGGRLNKKDGLTRYGDSHVKDKTS